MKNIIIFLSITWIVFSIAWGTVHETAGVQIGQACFFGAGWIAHILYARQSLKAIKKANDGASQSKNDHQENGAEPEPLNR